MIKLFNAFKEQDLKDLPVPPFTKWANGKIIRAEYGLMEIEFEVKNFEEYYNIMNNIQEKHNIIKSYESVIFSSEPKQSFVPKT